MAAEKGEQKHAVLRSALFISGTFGLAMACAVQSVVPVLAKVPGFIICGGGDMELFVRRRDSHGVCASGADIHYAIVLVVSTLVWALIASPAAFVIARRRAQKPS